MKKTGICKWLLILFLTVCLFCGCSVQPSQTKPTVVTGITVTYENGPIIVQRSYTTSAKMRAILNYLRWVDPYGAPEVDPESVTGSSFSIMLSYSDGKEKLYLQKADRYMLEAGQSWKKIDPDRAMTLSQMLGKMESDP